jgi:hypothetical protein
MLFGDDAGHAAGGVDEFGAGGVEAFAGGAYRGVDSVVLVADLLAVLLVPVSGGLLAAFGGRGDRGCELGEQLAVQLGGVFGVHPAGVGLGEGLLVGALGGQAVV